ncbi:unnamed protein product, partial [Sphenostylis stenocarpa]
MVEIEKILWGEDTRRNIGVRLVIRTQKIVLRVTKCKLLEQCKITDSNIFTYEITKTA